MTIDPNDPRPQNQLKQRIAPGIWEDRQGNIHWSIPELLAMVELEDTPANRAAVTAMLEDTMREHHPHAKIVHRKTPDTPIK